MKRRHTSELFVADPMYVVRDTFQQETVFTDVSAAALTMVLGPHLYHLLAIVILIMLDRVVAVKVTFISFHLTDVNTATPFSSSWLRLALSPLPSLPLASSTTSTTVSSATEKPWISTEGLRWHSGFLCGGGRLLTLCQG